MTQSIWEYIVGYAPQDEPQKVTFYDYHDETLYRELPLDVLGQHGWEMVSVLRSPDPQSGLLRYEYFFKRDRSQGYPPGFSKMAAN